MILEWSIILGAGGEKVYQFSYKAYALANKGTYEFIEEIHRALPFVQLV